MDKKEVIKVLEGLTENKAGFDSFISWLDDLDSRECTIALATAVEAAKDSPTDYNKIMRASEKAVLANSKHEVNTDEEIPYYKFRYNAFLSWFRGYRFQVSGDANGGGDYGSSDTTLRWDTEIAKRWPVEFRPLMAFSHVCQATSRYYDFWDFINKDASLLNTFMTATAEYDYSMQCKNFDYESILKMIEDSSKVDLTDTNRIDLARSYSKSANKEPDYLGSMFYGKGVVAFQDYKGKVYALNIPEYDEEEMESSEQDYYLNVWHRFTHVLLNIAGVVMNYQGLYYRDQVELQSATDSSIDDGRRLFDQMQKQVKAMCSKNDFNALLNAAKAGNV